MLSKSEVASKKLVESCEKKLEAHESEGAKEMEKYKEQVYKLCQGVDKLFADSDKMRESVIPSIAGMAGLKTDVGALQKCVERYKLERETKLMQIQETFGKKVGVVEEKIKAVEKEVQVVPIISRTITCDPMQ